MGINYWISVRGDSAWIVGRTLREITQFALGPDLDLNPDPDPDPDPDLDPDLNLALALAPRSSSCSCSCFSSLSPDISVG